MRDLSFIIAIKCENFLTVYQQKSPLYFMDDFKHTCERIHRNSSRFVELVWTFPSPPSSVNIFRAILAGSQPCVSKNAFWFVRGENRKGMPSVCMVQEETHRKRRVCTLTCRCLEACGCSYLHYRSQFLPWMKTTSALCHLEMTSYPRLINPKLITYWTVLPSARCQRKNTLTWYAAFYIPLPVIPCVYSVQ